MAKRKKPAPAEDRFKSANKPAANASNDAGARAAELPASAPPAKAPPRTGKGRTPVAAPPPELASLAPPPQRTTLESEGVTSEPDPAPAAAAEPSSVAESAPPSLEQNTPEPASTAALEASTPEPDPEPTPAAADEITTERESAVPESERAYASADARERIASRAYELYEGRGSRHGSDLEDWLEAERQVVRPTDRPTDE